MMRKVLAIAAFLIFFQVWFFNQYYPQGSVGWAVFVLGGHLCLGLALWSKKSKEAAAYAMLAVILAGISVFRGDTVFVGSFLGSGTVVFSILAVYFYVAEEKWLQDVQELIFVPFRLGIAFIRSFFTDHRRNLPKLPTGLNLWPVIRGLVIGIPLLFVLAALFSAGDPIFGAYVAHTFKFFKDLPQLFERLLVCLLWLLVLVPIVVMKINNKNNPRIGFGGKFGSESLVVVGLMVLVLGWFLVVQIEYLFLSVPEEQLIQYGVNTYSEYVNKGFGELSVASVIVYGVVSLSLAVFATLLESKKKRALLILNMLACGELLLLIVSVFKRVVVYANLHGLTTARIYGVIFLLWLLAMVKVLILRHYWQRRWVIVEVGLFAGLLLVMGLVNADQMVLKNPPRVNNQIDQTYLVSLSADGSEGWYSAYDWARGVADRLQNATSFSTEDHRQLHYAQMIANELIHKEDSLERNLGYLGVSIGGVTPILPGPDWHRLNFRQNAAYKEMLLKLPYENLVSLRDKLREIEKRMEETLKQPAALDRAPGRFVVK